MNDTTPVRQYFIDGASYALPDGTQLKAVWDAIDVAGPCWSFVEAHGAGLYSVRYDRQVIAETGERVYETNCDLTIEDFALCALPHSEAKLFGTRDQGVYCTTLATWAALWQLALDYGWQPAGTEPPEDDDGTPVQPWDGTYECGSMGQRMTDADAAAMASALQRACDALSEPDVRAEAEAFIPLCQAGGFILW